MTHQPVTKQGQPELPVTGWDERSPFIREFFMVQSDGFWGMAYRDEQGLWREAFNHMP